MKEQHTKGCAKHCEGLKNHRPRSQGEYNTGSKQHENNTWIVPN